MQSVVLAMVLLVGADPRTSPDFRQQTGNSYPAYPAAARSGTDNHLAAAAPAPGPAGPAQSGQVYEPGGRAYDPNGQAYYQGVPGGAVGGPDTMPGPATPPVDPYEGEDNYFRSIINNDLAWFYPMPQTGYSPRYGCYPGNGRDIHRYPAFHGSYYRRAYNYRNLFQHPWYAQLHEPQPLAPYSIYSQEEIPPGSQPGTPYEVIPPPPPTRPASATEGRVFAHQLGYRYE